jgi:hypothetical protein
MCLTHPVTPLTVEWRAMRIRAWAPRPATCALAFAMLFSLPIADSVYRIPIQVSDSLDVFQYVNELPGMRDVITVGLHASPTMLRPLRQVQTRLLSDAAEWFGGRYHAVFRGFHATLVIVLILLFTLAARVQTWPDLAALVFGLTVLTGLHTFAAMTREAYPVNHFLEISVYCLAILILAHSSRGEWSDIGAIACCALALLTLESGVLTGAVALTAYAAGARGISRTGLLGIVGVIAAYAYLRVGYLNIHAPVFGEHATGFGAGYLSDSEIVTRFGEHRWPLYAWTVSSGMLSVLLSQPRDGAWTLIAQWRSGMFPLAAIIQVLSSAGATALVVRYAIWKRGWRDPLVIIAAVVLVANALVGFQYAKDEVVSTAATFYALAVYAASRDLLHSWPALELTRIRRAGLVAALAAIATLWSVRSAGLHYVLRVAAFNARNEWVNVLPPLARDRWPPNPNWVRTAARLKEQALPLRTANPRQMPPWMERTFGAR